MLTRKPMLLLLVVLVAAQLTTIRAADDGDEYVRQVLEEDQQRYSSNDSYHTTEEEYQSQQQRQQDAQQRAAQEAADRVAADRERKFQAELDRIGDEEQRKAALKQKKQDGRRVRSILRAAKHNNLYGVLGIRNFQLKTPAIPVNLFNVAKFTIPGLTLWKGPTEKDLKKQFRKRAMQVHPDKNRDGRAQEAFVAVQNAHQVLGDAKLRSQYDEQRKAMQSEQWDSSKTLVSNALASAWAIIRKVIGVCQTVLGPFFVPVMIIGALII